MTPRALHLHDADTFGSENYGDETQDMGSMDADLAFQMRTSIRFVLVGKRVAELERQLEAQRSLVNRMLARWLVLGYPALTEDGV